MPLFDDFERTYSGPAQTAEPVFEYLNRSARSEFGQVRDRLEAWLARYPRVGKPDLRSRLRSRKDRAFYAAFWELYTHECLRALGYTLTAHPIIPGTSTTPDFLADKYGVSFYVECRLAWEETAEEERRRNRLSVVYDALQGKLDSPNFLLWVDAHCVGSAPIKTDPLVKHLADWLRPLDPETVHEVFRESGSRREALPSTEWETDGWRLTFCALPKPRQARDKKGRRALGVFSEGGGRWSNGTRRILQVLKEKGGKYESLDRPYVIALLCQGHFAEELDLVQALLGSEAAAIGSNAYGAMTVRPLRTPDGFWYRSAGPQYTRVSAVIGCFNLHPWNINEKTPLLVHNPWPSDALDPSALPWRSLVPNHEAGELQELAASVNLQSLLELPDAWPFLEGRDSAGSGHVPHDPCDPA